MQWKRLICSQDKQMDATASSRWSHLLCVKVWYVSHLRNTSCFLFIQPIHIYSQPERHAPVCREQILTWREGLLAISTPPSSSQSCSDTENHLLQMPCKLHCAPCGHVCATDWVLRWASFCLHGEDNWYSDKSVFRPLQEILNHRLNIKLLESNRVWGGRGVVSSLELVFHFIFVMFVYSSICVVPPPLWEQVSRATSCYRC